jgi:prepilin-type N-terminal cleavage/methylation domain-containing protein
MRFHSSPPSRRQGFTLVELLVTITIIVVLATLGFMGSKTFIKRAAAVKDVTNMRNVWTGIVLYAGENSDKLPGPINGGQRAVYGLASTGRISFYIAPYLGYEDSKTGDFLEAMASSWQKSPSTQAAPCYFIRADVPVSPDPGATTFQPWGYPAKSKPMTLSAAMSKMDPSRTWAITDLDQLHPNAQGAGWINELPTDMAHGSYRLATYFDGSGGKVNVRNERQ